MNQQQLLSCSLKISISRLIKQPYPRIHAAVPPDLSAPLHSLTAYYLLTLSQILVIQVRRLLEQKEPERQRQTAGDQSIESNQVYRRFTESLSAEERKVLKEFKKQIYELIRYFKSLIVRSYHSSLKIVCQETDQFNGLTAKLQIPNRLIVLIMLKQLAGRILSTIKEELFQMMPNVPIDLVQDFAQFILQNQGRPEVFQSSKALSDLSQKIGLLPSNILRVQEYDNSQLIITYTQDFTVNDVKTTIIKAPSFQSTPTDPSPKILSKTSSYFQAKEKVMETLRGAPLKAELNFSSGLSSLGGSLGSSLIKLCKSKNKKEFIKSFGKKSIQSSSITILVQSIPIAGALLMVSGLGLSLHHIFNSDALDLKTKAYLLTQFAASTGTSILSGTTGAIIGQTAIPIPILGAFVGGIIGGACGQVLKQMGKSLRKVQTKRLINSIEALIESDGSWQDRRIISWMGLKTHYFQKSIPEYLSIKEEAQSIWLSVICLNLISALHVWEQKEEEREQSQQENEFEEARREGIPLSVKMCEGFLQRHRIDLKLCQRKAQKITLQILKVIN